MTEQQPLRGKRGKERRLGDRVATEFAARHATIDPADAVDFDIGDAEASIDGFYDAERREAEREADGTEETTRGGGSAGAARGRGLGRGRAGAAVSKAGRAQGRGAGRRPPDLSALPPLLAATGSFASLRERLAAREGGPAASGRVVGRHAGLTSVPHGAKSYLAATFALVAGGERLLWIARDAEIGDRVAEELAAWLGDPEAVVALEPRTALAYERSELVADETAARVAALSAWRSGRARILVAGVQALVQHTIDPEDLPAEPRELRIGGRLHQDALLRELLDLGYAPTAEVAGRGEFSRRGGIVDVFPPSAPLPVRVEFFGDEIDSLRAFDPTDQRAVGPLEQIVLLPASEFLHPRDGVAALRERLGRAAARLPERLAEDLARFEAGETSRALNVGDAAEIWAPLLAPASGLDHIPPETLLVLDEPGDLAEAADFLWRQADERRAELVESRELPKDWPSTYLGPRDWKSRLVGGRTLELTWESEPPRVPRWPVAA